MSTSYVEYRLLLGVMLSELAPEDLMNTFFDEEELDISHMSIPSRFVIKCLPFEKEMVYCLIEKQYYEHEFHLPLEVYARQFDFADDLVKALNVENQIISGIGYHKQSSDGMVIAKFQVTLHDDWLGDDEDDDDENVGDELELIEPSGKKKTWQSDRIGFDDFEFDGKDDHEAARNETETALGGTIGNWKTTGLDE